VLTTIILVACTSRGLVGRTASDYINGVGSIFIAALLMWIGLNILLFRERTVCVVEDRISDTKNNACEFASHQ